MSRSRLCAAAVSALIVLAGQSVHAASPHPDAAESTTPRGYILSIDDGGPGATALSRGDYAAAVAEAAPYSRHHRSLSAMLTLCAANISLGELLQAQSVCDSAVELAAKPLTTTRNPHGHANREALAKAHSNRGVLRALQGDLVGAQVDFDLASKQRRYRDVVLHNLEVAASAQALLTAQ